MEKVVGNTSVLCFRKFPVAKKFMDKKGRERSIKIFRHNFFVSQCRKNFVGEPFHVLLVSGIEKSYASEGYVSIFCRKFFVSQYRNIS